MAEQEVPQGKSERLAAEQVRLLYARTSHGLTGSLLSGVVLVGMLWGDVPSRSLILWLIALFAVSVERWWRALRYRRAAPSIADSARWRRPFIAGTTASGAVWGSTALFLFPESIVQQTFLVFVLGGLVAGASGAYSVTLSATAAFAIPTLAPFVVRAVWLGDQVHLAMAAIIALLGALGLVTARQVRDMTSDSLRLRFENADLVDKLRRERQQVGETNRLLHEANAELKTASAAKSRFIANMSHEIRTPMNGVLGMAELLADTDQTHQQKQFTATIRSSAHALLTVINDILDFSKIEAGKLELESARFNLREVVESVAVMLADQAQRNGVELTHELDDDVPTTALGDQGRLRQILINLVGNAVKFTADGEIVVRVSVVERHEEIATVRFAVHDTGIGIGAGDQQRIFDGFAQADGSMTRKHGGTGLGLTIAKSLTMMMGGEIGVVSEVGRGSEFWFTVPLEGAPATADDPQVAHVELEGVDVPQDNGGRADSSHLPVNAEDVGVGRILLVEDNSVNQAVAKAMLERLGHVVDAVENGEQALAAYSAKTYDLILMDGQMPEMDGYEATQKIRQLESRKGNVPKAGEESTHVTIVAMTAHAMQGDRERCLAAGMDDYLSKPFTRQQLSDTIRRWLPHSPNTDPDGTSGRVRVEVDEIPV